MFGATLTIGEFISLSAMATGEAVLVGGKVEGASDPKALSTTAAEALLVGGKVGGASELNGWLTARELPFDGRLAVTAPRLEAGGTEVIILLIDRDSGDATLDAPGGELIRGS